MNDSGSHFEIVITPEGLLLMRPAGLFAGASADDPWVKRAAVAFESGPGAGLFSLAATRPQAPPPPAFAFWAEFAGRYLAALCRVPPSSSAGVEPPAPPEPEELRPLIRGAPPMPGGEYLSVEVLRSRWDDLDGWARGEIARSKTGLGEWLETHAPMWRQVGRVCFHLAENKRAPDHPFAFLATYAPRLSSAGRVQYQPLGHALVEYAGARNRQTLISLLSPIHRAQEKSAFVRGLVESGDVYHPLAWTPTQAYRLLKDVPILEASGLLVRLPDWWRKRPRPRVVVTIGASPRNRLGTDALLDFSVGAALGDETLSDEEWRAIMASSDGLAFVKGRWIEVDRAKLSEALDHWKRVEAEAGKDGVSFVEGMRLLAGAPASLDGDDGTGGTGGTDGTDGTGGTGGDWHGVVAGEWLSSVLSQLREPGQASNGAPPKGLRGTLRNYQQEGHRWLWLLSNLGLGACLADDMGLGKTIQVLSLLLAAKESGGSNSKPSLLVLPASLLSNWKAEAARFAPTLDIRFVHPSQTPKDEWAEMEKRPDRFVHGADAVLTTYGMLLRQPWLVERPWRLVILDEAQAIKNPSARQTRIVKQLESEARIALTGTPVENRLSDLWSLFDFLCPGLLGSAAKFKAFVKNLEQRERDRYAPLRNLVGPYILRRLKTDQAIVPDLPDKTEVKAFCRLSKKQAALYARSVAELAQALDQREDRSDIQRRGIVLVFLLRFKQICNHPSQYLGDGGYAPSDSGKFDRLRGLCEEIALRQEKALVFTQFREMTEPLAGFLTGVFGRPGLVLHGGISVGKRGGIVEAFQKPDGPPFFVLSLKAGGTGLNLTAASHVVHFDRWWNPAVENQATDRAFRIGQHRNVVVHKFLCEGTVEEKIDALIEEKTNLAGDILKAGAEALLTEMSDADLLRLVALDLDRACE